jgi:hypothetical protein
MLHERGVFMEIAHRFASNVHARASSTRQQTGCLGAAGQSWCTTPTTADRSTALHVLAAPVAATSEVVTNGVSQYSRNERNANAGIVVGMARNYGGPLASIGTAPS